MAGYTPNQKILSRHTANAVLKLAASSAA